jgi:hypothetical protein
MLSDVIKIVGAGFWDPTRMHLVQDNDVVHTLTPIDPISRLAKPFCQGGRLVSDVRGAQSVVTTLP